MRLSRGCGPSSVLKKIVGRNPKICTSNGEKMFKLNLFFQKKKKSPLLLAYHPNVPKSVSTVTISQLPICSTHSGFSLPPLRPHAVLTVPYEKSLVTFQVTKPKNSNPVSLWLWFCLVLMQRTLFLHSIPKQIQSQQGTVTFNEAVIRWDHTVNIISFEKFLLHTFSVAPFVPLCTQQGEPWFPLLKLGANWLPIWRLSGLQTCVDISQGGFLIPYLNHKIKCHILVPSGTFHQMFVTVTCPVTTGSWRRGALVREQGECRTPSVSSGSRNWDLGAGSSP